VNRRYFVLRGVATAIGAHIHQLEAKALPVPVEQVNLISGARCKAPNYWCTWAVQNYMYGHRLPHLSPEVLEGDSGSRLAHEAMNEEVLLGKDGWANTFFPKVREDLYLMLDDGWERGGTASFELDTLKFPSYSGSLSNRLGKLNQSIKSHNWRGAALWCRNTPGGQKDEGLEDLSNEAGIRYWKIDIGDPDFHLVDLRRSNHEQLQFEHVHGELPVNGDWRRDGRFGVQPPSSRRQQILSNTDVYRTYDVTSILSLPTTLDRLAEMLKGAQRRPDVRALLNVEDEAYVAAAMGCTMGVLRYPLDGLRPRPDLDLFFNGPRRTKRRMDEVVRALRWQRIAPPYSAGSGSVETSEETLTDSWVFDRGQTWQTNLIGQTVYQGAPAMIARNIAMPKVEAAGGKPFVFATGFPNGAVGIGVQERTRPGHAWYMPHALVEVDVGDNPGPFGVFGACSLLRLTFNYSIAKKRIWVQDLAADRALDVTGQVSVHGNKLELTERNLRTFGLSGATKGDLSSPGLVLAIS
jgi:hypothetical protein